MMTMQPGLHVTVCRVGFVLLLPFISSIYFKKKTDMVKKITSRTSHETIRRYEGEYKLFSTLPDALRIACIDGFQNPAPEQTDDAAELFTQAIIAYMTTNKRPIANDHIYLLEQDAALNRHIENMFVSGTKKYRFPAKKVKDVLKEKTTVSKIKNIVSGEIHWAGVPPHTSSNALNNKKVYSIDTCACFEDSYLTEEEIHKAVVSGLYD
jgi:hypothetical protein